MAEGHRIVVVPGGVAASRVLGDAAPPPEWIRTDGLRRPATGRLCCCVLDPFADRPLEDVWPRWARAPDVGLVVVTGSDPAGTSARPERAGLLACADGIVPVRGDDAAGVRARIVQACEQAMTARRDVPVPTPRIAIVTPWEPDRAGPATSIQRLVHAGIPEARFDVIAQDDLATYHQAVEVEGWSATVCSIGDSRFHIPAWHALMRGRGDVLLHDARISGLYEALLRDGSLSPRQYRDTLLRLEASRLPAAMRADPPAPVDGGDALRLGLMFTGDVIDRAGRILVHSEAARRLVVAERDDDVGPPT